MIDKTNIYYDRLTYIKIQNNIKKNNIKKNNIKNNIEYKDDNNIKSIIELDKSVISEELINYIDEFVNTK
jgi:hypothetical protein